MSITLLKSFFTFLIIQFFVSASFAQYKSFEVAANGDTINIVDKKGLKQGKWVIKIPELRGEPGYVETGAFKDNQKEGEWRRYNLSEDLLAVENYMLGGKDGIQKYYTRFGALIREENWKGYNPDAPYDTIAIYGTGSNEIIDMKVVKAEQYSVKHGTWKFYEASTGRLLATEQWDRGAPVKPLQQDIADVDPAAQPRKIVKPQAVIDFERKHGGKKKVKLNNGSTSH